MCLPAQGIISHASLEKAAAVRRQGAAFVIVSGARTSTVLTRLPYLPAADAIISENGATCRVCACACAVCARRQPQAASAPRDAEAHAQCGSHMLAQAGVAPLRPHAVAVCLGPLRCCCRVPLPHRRTHLVPGPAGPHRWGAQAAACPAAASVPWRPDTSGCQAPTTAPGTGALACC